MLIPRLSAATQRPRRQAEIRLLLVIARFYLVTAIGGRIGVERKSTITQGDSRTAKVSATELNTHGVLRFLALLVKTLMTPFTALEP